jgi:uncharacterized protein YndB with AHSA1/START domain
MTTAAKTNVTMPNDREITITREFNAPRDLVFDCYTKPELLKRWMHGPDGWLLTVCDNDLTIGGAFRWVWRHADGREMGIHGIYKDIVRPKRIVRTELFEVDWAGGEALGVLELAEQNGRTTVTATVLYATAQARDGALACGMEDGTAKSHARLDALLASQIRSSQSAA